MVSIRDQVLVVHLGKTSLEKLVSAKLEVLLKEHNWQELNISNLYDFVLEQVEKPLLEVVMRATGGNQVKAASLLGLHRNTLHKKLVQYNLIPARSRAKRRSSRAV